MTTEIGFYFVIFILAMIPMVFLFAGKDTTQRHAERKQRQTEALLDWTDKAVLAAEHTDTQKKPAAVEVVSRDLSGVYAA